MLQATSAEHSWGWWEGRSEAGGRGAARQAEGWKKSDLCSCWEAEGELAAAFFSFPELHPSCLGVFLKISTFQGHSQPKADDLTKDTGPASHSF